MKQHSFDPFAFVFGLLFVGVGLPLLLSDSGFSAFKGRWTLPAFLILAGAVVLATTQRRVARSESVMPPSDDDSDLGSMNPY